MSRPKITMRRYSHECGDGCCYEDGHEWYVDGKLVHSSPCEFNGWLAVLEHFNIQADFTEEDSNKEEIWSL